MLEVLQRDGNATAFRAMDRGVVVDLGGLADPDALALLDRLDAAGIDVTVKLASDELGVVGAVEGGDQPVHRAAVPPPGLRGVGGRALGERHPETVEGLGLEVVGRDLGRQPEGDAVLAAGERDAGAAQRRRRRR